MNSPISSPASILCVTMGHFAQAPSGLSRYVHELTHQLADNKDHVELGGIGFPEAATDSTITLTNLASPNSGLPRRLWDIRQKFCRRSLLDFDAINLHFALYSLPILQNFPKNTPITFSFHGPWALESQWEGASQQSILFKRWVERRVYNRCDRFIVLSKAFGQLLHETYDIPWSKIHVIPGGVNTAHFQLNLSRQEARSKLGWHLDRKILFTPRRLVNRMGLDHLLTAMVQVKKQVPDVWLAIAGKGSLRDTLERQAQELELSQHVQFLGFLPDEQLPIAYQAADLTVVPSQNLEGFGLVLAESLSCGTPALCTPIGGMPEVLAPFCPDLITQSADIDAIASRLIELLNDQTSLPSRAACREYAATQFDWQIIAQQVRQVLLA
jgi:glycosyltransferase involved in cell wall biosynthesis